MTLEKDAFDRLQEEPTRLVRILAKTDPLTPEYTQVLNALYRIGLVHELIKIQKGEMPKSENTESALTAGWRKTQSGWMLPLRRSS